MNKVRLDQEESIFSTAEINKLYEEFAITVRNDGFDTQQQKDDVVKNEIEKLNKLVRRKKMNLRLIWPLQYVSNWAVDQDKGTWLDLGFDRGDCRGGVRCEIESIFEQ